jgi:hypothetical protein
MGPQLHDFNPGNLGVPADDGANGVFWTQPIPDTFLDIQSVDDGLASFAVDNYSLFDYGSIIKSITNPTGRVPGSVSFKLNWTGVINPVSWAVDAIQSSFDGIQGTATMEWTGNTGTYTFVSDPGNTSITNFVILGKEKNGVFYNGSS